MIGRWLCRHGIHKWLIQCPFNGNYDCERKGCDA